MEAAVKALAEGIRKAEEKEAGEGEEGEERPEAGVARAMASEEGRRGEMGEGQAREAVKVIAAKLKAYRGEGEREARRTAGEHLRKVQQAAVEMVTAWSERAEAGERLARRRQDKREWMRLVMRGWREQAETEKRAREGRTGGGGGVGGGQGGGSNSEGGRRCVQGMEEVGKGRMPSMRLTNTEGTAWEESAAGAGVRGRQGSEDRKRKEEPSKGKADTGPCTAEGAARREAGDGKATPTEERRAEEVEGGTAREAHRREAQRWQQPAQPAQGSNAASITGGGMQTVHGVHSERAGDGEGVEADEGVEGDDGWAVVASRRGKRGTRRKAPLWPVDGEDDAAGDADELATGVSGEEEGGPEGDDEEVEAEANGWTAAAGGRGGEGPRGEDEDEDADWEAADVGELVARATAERERERREETEGRKGKKRKGGRGRREGMRGALERQEAAARGKGGWRAKAGSEGHSTGWAYEKGGGAGGGESREATREEVRATGHMRALSRYAQLVMGEALRKKRKEKVEEGERERKREEWKKVVEEIGREARGQRETERRKREAERRGERPAASTRGVTVVREGRGARAGGVGAGEEGAGKRPRFAGWGVEQEEEGRGTERRGTKRKAEVTKAEGAARARGGEKARRTGKQMGAWMERLRERRADGEGGRTGEREDAGGREGRKRTREEAEGEGREGGEGARAGRREARARKREAVEGRGAGREEAEGGNGGGKGEERGGERGEDGQGREEARGATTHHTPRPNP